MFPRPSLKGKTREEVQREIDAEREAKNVGTAFGIPLAVIMYLIERARADELDEARERFGLARMDSDPSGQVIEGQHADDPNGDDDNYKYDNGEEGEYDSDTADSDDDEEMYDLDGDGDDYEIDYGEEDDVERYDPNGYDEPDDDDDQKSGPVMKFW